MSGAFLGGSPLISLSQCPSLSLELADWLGWPARKPQGSPVSASLVVGWTDSRPVLSFLSGSCLRGKPYTRWPSSGLLRSHLPPIFNFPGLILILMILTP